MYFGSDYVLIKFYMIVTVVHWTVQLLVFVYHLQLHAVWNPKQYSDSVS